MVDASTLFLPPGRAQRPSFFVVLVRGIPGSGKSWLAQKLRSLEVEHGARPPRILSIDPYFLSEVEDDVATGATGSAARSAPREEYRHDHEMEGTKLMFRLGVRHIVCHQSVQLDQSRTGLVAHTAS